MKKILFILNHVVLLTLLTGISVSSVSAMTTLDESGIEIMNHDKAPPLDIVDEYHQLTQNNQVEEGQIDTQEQKNVTSLLTIDTTDLLQSVSKEETHHMSPILTNQINLPYTDYESNHQDTSVPKNTSSDTYIPTPALTQVTQSSHDVKDNLEIEENLNSEFLEEEKVASFEKEEFISEQSIPQLDLAKLNDLIEKVASKRAIDYVTATWKVFDATLDDARGLRNMATEYPESVTQEEIDEITKQLLSAIDGLVLINKPQSVDFDLTHLNKAIEVVLSEKEVDYTKDSWANLIDILNTAKNMVTQALNTSSNITQNQIDEITKKLVAAHVNLEEVVKPNTSGLSLNALNDLIKKADKEKATGYLMANWKVFIAILDDAREIQKRALSHPEQVTQDQIDEVVGKLTKAQADLDTSEKPVKSEQPKQPEEIQLDLSRLVHMIQSAEELKEGDYTKESWAIYANTLNEAATLQQKAEKTPGEVSQERVDEVVSGLELAKQQLVFIEVPTKTSEDTSNDHKSEPKTQAPDQDDHQDSHQTINQPSGETYDHETSKKPTGVNQSERLPQTSEKNESFVITGLVLIVGLTVYSYRGYKHTY